MTSLPVTFRIATEDDIPFFYNATLQSHYYSSSTNKHILPGIYFAEHKLLLSRLLQHPTTRLSIVCDESSPEVIMGFCLHDTEDDIVHYIYVKRPFRRFGIGTMLMAYAEISVPQIQASHWTYDATAIWRKHCYPGVAFNPYILGDLTSDKYSRSQSEASPFPRRIWPPSTDGL